MNTKYCTRFLYIFLSVSIFSIQSKAQCLDWITPNPTVGWNDFNTTYGGAPCDDGTGCPVYEFETFEVLAAEAYLVNNFIVGGEYAFSICNGPGAGSWVPEFTIVAPSGAIDAFGPGVGDSCTISWTASESGTYYIIINEAGHCGDGSNTNVHNGYPALTCLSNAACLPPVTTCNAGNLITTGTTIICGNEERFDIMVELDTVPTGGGVGFFFSNELGGTGGPGGEFTYRYSTLDASFNNTLNGSIVPLSGEWVIRSVVFSDDDNPLGSICSTSSNSLTVRFGPPFYLNAIGDAGNGSAIVIPIAGTPPYTYLWSDSSAQTTPTAINLTPGEYSVTVTDNIGCTIEGTTTVNSIPAAVDNIESVEHLALSPNPTSGQITLDFALDGFYDVNFEIMDITGRKILTQSQRTAGDKIDFDLSNQTSGVYFLRINVEGEVLVRRIIVSN